MLARIYALVVLRLNFHLCMHIPSISNYLTISGTELMGGAFIEIMGDTILELAFGHYDLVASVCSMRNN
jgi:hypothetical protein